MDYSSKGIGRSQTPPYFNNGACKVFDFAQVLAKGMPIFEPLKNLTVFRNIVLDGWTVTWQDGTIDIAPEYLYEHGVTV